MNWRTHCGTRRNGWGSPWGRRRSRRRDGARDAPKRRQEQRGAIVWRSAIAPAAVKKPKPWYPPAGETTLRIMDTMHSETGHPPPSEAERQRQIAWEAEQIAEADADIAAGRLVDSATVRTWIDSIGTSHELPVPYSGR